MVCNCQLNASLCHPCMVGSISGGFGSVVGSMFPDAALEVRSEDIQMKEFIGWGRDLSFGAETLLALTVSLSTPSIIHLH